MTPRLLDLKFLFVGLDQYAVFAYVYMWKLTSALRLGSIIQSEIEHMELVLAIIRRISP